MKRPNILVIQADQLTAGVLPMYGHPLVQTPHMSRLAERGITFTARMNIIFLLAQLVFWMLRAPDGHAKNFSLFVRPQGAYGLTPLYDVMSAWPLIGEGPGLLSEHKIRLAMAIRSTNATSPAASARRP